MNIKLKSTIHQTIIFLMVTLWIYTVASKLADYREFKQQLAGQYIFRSNVATIAPIIIFSEITTVLLLIFKKTRVIGFKLSLLLMVGFTIYIGLVLFNFFDKVPCSCGGVLKDMGWQIHFWFNVFFTILAGFGLYLEIYERSSINQVETN